MSVINLANVRERKRLIGIDEAAEPKPHYEIDIFVTCPSGAALAIKRIFTEQEKEQFSSILAIACSEMVVGFHEEILQR